jgi:hypothetical protein
MNYGSARRERHLLGAAQTRASRPVGAGVILRMTGTFS